MMTISSMSSRQLREAAAAIVALKRELTASEEARLERIYAEQERRRQKGQRI